MTGVHVGELALRRLRAGELTSPDSSAVKAHLGGCPECGAKLEGLVTEQQRFEQEVPFERFAAGVERAARSPRAAPVAPRAPWLYPAMGMAAALLFALVAQPVIQATTHNRTKGGADIVLRIAGAEDGPQRIAAPGTPEILGPGERVRIGSCGR